MRGHRGDHCSSVEREQTSFSPSAREREKRQIPRSSHFTSHPLPLFLCRIYCINKDRRHRSEERERLTQAAPSFSLHWTQLSAGAPWTVVGSTGSKQAGPPPPHQHQRRHLKSTRLPRKDSWVRPLLLRCGVPLLANSPICLTHQPCCIYLASYQQGPAHSQARHFHQLKIHWPAHPVTQFSIGGGGL